MSKVGSEMWICIKCGNRFVTDGEPQFSTYEGEIQEMIEFVELSNKHHPGSSWVSPIDHDIARFQEYLYGDFPSNIYKIGRCCNPDEDKLEKLPIKKQSLCVSCKKRRLTDGGM